MRPFPSRAPVFLTVALTILPVALARAQETASDTLLTVDHYLDWEQVGDPQLSPDGAQVIYTRRWVNKIEDKWESALWIMNADGSHNRFLVKGSDARWSPDGSRILYLADGDPKGTQIFVRWMDAEGASSQVTRVTEIPTDPRWAPGGKSISFAMLVRDSSLWTISLPKPPEGAKWTPAPRVIDRLHYRQDRVGDMPQGFTHLFLVPADGGTARQLTSGHWNAGARFDGLALGVGYDWTPDGRTIVFDGLRDTTWDRQYEVSRIYALDVTSGTIKLLVSRPGFWAQPAVSPDGRTIAFTGYDSTAHTHRTADLWTAGIDGSGMRDLSRTLDRDPDNLRWSPDGKGVYFTAPDKGSINVRYADLSGGVRDITQGAQVVSLVSLSRTLVAVGVRSDPQHPADVVRIDLKKAQAPVRLTEVNDDVVGNKRLASVEEIWYGSSGGARVQGWIVKPPTFDAAKKYPLILEIHGGPFAMYNVGFSYMFQNFAANGYVVLYVNPRGSTGYGDAFSNAIDHDYPGPDYDDLMAGVDAVVGKGFVDTTRMYVSGCSGGGVLSSWVIGHTNRFAAAAVRCPVIDWISMAGQTDIPLFTFSFFHQAFWDKPDEWLAHSSLMYAGRVTTPTLLMTGELDRRTPIPQTEEFFTALKYRGVTTMMLRFNGEYHGTGSKPSNFMRTQLYMMSWFQKYHRGGTEPATGAGNR
ncbi:MAG TPA: S9 family peptidase [Gemmatimonadales bacterium]|nr:S9 family peptidase [Gemmatimonadales bacterium]